jgi:hypothetical protein
LQGKPRPSFLPLFTQLRRGISMKMSSRESGLEGGTVTHHETSPSSVGRIAGHRLAAEAGLWHPSSPAEKTRSGRGGRRMTSRPRRLGPCCLQIPGENAPTVGCHPKLRMAPRDSIIPLGGRRGPDRRRSFSGQAWSRYVSHPSTSCLLAWWRCPTRRG